MADVIQWNNRGIRSNIEELQLLCNQYTSQVVAVQESQLRKNKAIKLNGFVGITKSSVDDNSTGGVSMYVNKSCLFS